MSDWYSEMIEQAHKNDPTARIASLETALAESQLKLEGAERWNGIYQGEIAALKAECERLRRDAELYRKLRAFNWHDNAICCVVKPMENVKLGAYCPSGENLDAAIDAASAEGGR